MAEHAGKPKVRFAGFTEDWEQRNVGDLLIERDEQAPKSNKYPLMAFIANEGVAPKGERYDRSSLVTDTVNKLYKKTEFGDFIYSSNNLETGSIGLNNYGKASISPVYSIFFPTQIADSDFLGRRLVRKDFINEMVKWRQGVIYGQWRIHESDFVKIKIFVPSVEEQSRIGSFFRHLDRLITLHQRKRGRLENIKKAMLEKMFPKNGADVPEVRFAGFTEDWEQREFKNLFKILPNNTLSRAELSFEKGIVKNLHYGDILIKFNEILDSCDKKIPFISRDMNFEKIKNAILKNGDVVIADAAEDEAVGKCTEIFNISQNEQIISGLHTIPCRPNIDFAQGFLGYYMNSNSYHSQLVPLMQGIKVLSLSKSSLQDTLITFPRTKKEQARIGTFFRQLDRLVALHQRKVALLQNIKKACLEKMFV